MQSSMRKYIYNATDTEAQSMNGGTDDSVPTRKRHASVYDAVAGRVTSTRSIDAHKPRRSRAEHHMPQAPDSRRSNTVLAPEEVLFRRTGAPMRYAEKDIYQAHEDLPDGGRDALPDSDLLKTMHEYASRFYADLPDGGDSGGGGNNERSMDETALLAFGILLEEAGREALGQRGDLVFTEGADVGADEDAEDGEDVKVFGFMDAPMYEARGGLKHPHAKRSE